MEGDRREIWTVPDDWTDGTHQPGEGVDWCARLVALSASSACVAYGAPVAVPSSDRGSGRVSGFGRIKIKERYDTTYLGKHKSAVQKTDWRSLSLFLSLALSRRLCPLRSPTTINHPACMVLCAFVTARFLVLAPAVERRGEGKGTDDSNKWFAPR